MLTARTRHIVPRISSSPAAKRCSLSHCRNARLARWALAILASAAIHTAVARGQTTSWNTTSGNWSAPGNWTNGVPGAGYTVNLINSDGNTDAINYDYIGVITLGTVTIDNTGGGTDTLEINANYLLTTDSMIVGNNGNGDLDIDFPGVTVNSVLILGNLAGSSGTINLHAEDELALPSGIEIIGNFGTGTLNSQVDPVSSASNTVGGEVILGNNATGIGTYNLDGNLTSTGSQIVGSYGTGTFAQTAGSYNTVGSELDIGQFAGSHGSYTLSGNSTLTVNGNGLYVGGSSAGAGGAGTLTVGSGSSVTVAGTLQVFPGASNSVTLNGGTITANAVTLASPSQLIWNSGTLAFNGNLVFDSTPAANFTGSSFTLGPNQTLMANAGETIGENGTATFTQIGGTHIVAATLVISGSATGNGTYNISGGLLEVESDSLLGGFFIGFGGTGAVYQTGGTVVGPEYGMAIGDGGPGTYNLVAGTLTATGYELIADGGPGTFNQSGGTNSISGQYGLLVGPGGKYMLSAGTLSVNGPEVIGYGGPASFVQTGGASIITGNGNDVDIGGYLFGATYTLSGGTLYAGGNVWVGQSYSPAGNSLSVSETSGPSLLTVVGTLTVYPGSSLSLYGGEIQVGALDLQGTYSSFNWSLGTLEITNTNVVLDNTIVGPTNPLGAALTITDLQTLIVDRNETIGGAGPGSLTINGTNIVGGTLTLTPEGTLTVSSGGRLSYASFIQEGGTVSGTIVNTGSYTYQGGLFNGRLVNQGTVSLGNNFTAGNGIENDASMSLAAGQKLIVNGQGFDNLGSFTMSGGTIGGNGPFTNDYGGVMTASSGTINQSIVNNGALNVTGAFAIGGGANYGLVTIDAGGNLRPAPGAGPFVNDAGGVVQGAGGALTMIFGNDAGGEVVVPAGNSLSITGAWPNAGLVTLEGTGAALNGGTITNSSVIQGVGHIGAAVLNSGIVTASGGELDLDGTGNTNTSSGQIQAPSGSTVLYLQGLTTNSGIIALSGGTFNNGNQPLANASGASIEGSGTLETGGLTSAGSVYFANNATSVFGSVATTTGGTFTISNNTTTFYGAVTVGSGSIFTASKATATFLNTFTNNGTFISDPSSLAFTSLVIGSTGTVQASAGDLYRVTGNLTNASTQSSTWNAAGATLQFTGGGTHTMNVSGSVGSYGWGTLQIAAGNTVQINGNSATATLTNNAGTIDQTSGSNASLGVVSGVSSSGSGTTVYTGNLIVGDGGNPSELTATQILQNTLTINAGSTVTIAPSGPGIPAVEAGDSIASDGAAVSGEALADGSSETGAASTSADSDDPFLAIQAAIASGAISSAKGEQLENRIAAIERLAAADPGLDVSLLENRVLSSLPSSIWTSADASPLVGSDSGLLGVESGLPDSNSSGATAAFSPTAGVGSPAAVPEPTTLLLAILGGVGLAVVARRRRRITGWNR